MRVGDGGKGPSIQCINISLISLFCQYHIPTVRAVPKVEDWFSPSPVLRGWQEGLAAFSPPSRLVRVFIGSLIGCGSVACAYLSSLPFIHCFLASDIAIHMSSVLCPNELILFLKISSVLWWGFQSSERGSACVQSLIFI